MICPPNEICARLYSHSFRYNNETDSFEPCSRCGEVLKHNPPPSPRERNPEIWNAAYGAAFERELDFCATVAIRVANAAVEAFERATKKEEPK